MFFFFLTVGQSYCHLLRRKLPSRLEANSHGQSRRKHRRRRRRRTSSTDAKALSKEKTNRQKTDSEIEAGTGQQKRELQKSSQSSAEIRRRQEGCDRCQRSSGDG